VKAMKKGKNTVVYKHTIHPRTAAGAISQLIEKAPELYEAGKKLIKDSAGAQMAMMRKSGGRVKGGIVPGYGGSQVVAPSTGTRSMNRQDAPTSLAIKFDGPEYRFSACSFDGMNGLKMSGTQILASVEQNTTTTLRGLLRTLALAGVAGDTSMQGSTITPTGNYQAGTTVGRITVGATPLGAIASPFRKYRWKKLVVKFESELPTTTAGGLAIGFSSDASDAVIVGGAVTAVVVTQMNTSLLTSVWDDAILDCSASLDKSLKNMNPLSTSLNSLLYELAAPGLLCVVGDSAFTANLVIGKIVMAFEIELYGVGPVPSSFAVMAAKEAVKAEKKRDLLTLAYKEVDRKEKERQEEEKKQEDEEFEKEYGFDIFDVSPISSTSVPKERAMSEKSVGNGSVQSERRK
jgi:hypothetical protein